MANTYYGLSSVELTNSSTTTVTFSSIPSTYTDLALILSIRSTYNSTSDTPLVRVNGDSSANYTYSRVASVNGTTITAARATSSSALFIPFITALQSTSDTFSSYELYFGQYKNTNVPKTIMWWGNQPSNSLQQTRSGFGGGQYGLLLPDFSAISSISISVTDFFASGSAFYLYGIS